MSAAPETPRFHHYQEVYHLTDDVPGRILAHVRYADCFRYKVAWQGRTIEEHAGGELTTTKPLLISSSQAGDED